MKARRLQTLIVKDAALWRLADGRKAFVKMAFSDSRAAIERVRMQNDRERKCLEALQGLAVPELLSLDLKEFPRFSGQRNIICMAQSFAGDHTANHLRLPPDAAAGVWLFVAEQFAAFRRRGVLYCDCNCENIVGKKDPLRVMIVDFDSCSFVTSGQRTLTNYGFTPGAYAPDVGAGKDATERTLVFEVSLLLFRLLTDMDNQGLNHPTRGLGRALGLLKRLGAPGLGTLLVSCLDREPDKRPLDYEDLLGRIKAVSLPLKIRKHWERLRAPYVAGLAEVGL